MILVIPCGVVRLSELSLWHNGGMLLPPSLPPFLPPSLPPSFPPSYFESGVCSVYLWDLDHGFAGVVLIKKAGDTEKIKGCWDSIHVVEVQVHVCPTAGHCPVCGLWSKR